MKRNAGEGNEPVERLGFVYIGQESQQSDRRRQTCQQIDKAFPFCFLVDKKQGTAEQKKTQRSCEGHSAGMSSVKGSRSRKKQLIDMQICPDKKFEDCQTSDEDNDG